MTQTNNHLLFLATISAICVSNGVSSAQQNSIAIHADQVLHRLTPYLTGACIEDVNHEIYGGIDSQMIFGESFAEPAAQLPLKGFSAYGGCWTPTEDGGIQGVGSDGAKIIWGGGVLAEGEVSVDVKLTEPDSGNAGLILKVKDAAIGADKFTGYEVSLERPGALVLGRHRQNWEPIRRVPCTVPVDEWNNLCVRLGATSLEVVVNGQSMMQYEDTDHPLDSGAAGVRIWRHKACFRNLSINVAGERKQIPFDYESGNNPADSVSGMWRPIRQGDVKGSLSLVSQDVFLGGQSQQITFTSGSGVIGIENRSLNRWGMNFVKDKPYEGYLYVRSEKETEFRVTLESKDGSAVYSEKSLKVNASGWQRLDFELTPTVADKEGRFTIQLKQPGSVTVGYAFLQPGDWGRFKGLPVRKDVAEGLINQGITVLRMGGCMVNTAEYRWKKMTGPRALRPPYQGFWYPYSSDGWGIIDFLNFCEAAGFLGIPALNIDETPEDMADFVEYVNGPVDTQWGAKRALDGHPKPYQLKYIEFGNEEHVNDIYFQKFKPMAEAVWAKDTSIIVTVADLCNHKTITDPFNITGHGFGLTTLAPHQKILHLAKQHNREVWFDLHVGTDGPRPDDTLEGMFSYIDALEKIADGANFKIVVFELNSGNHSQRRALANALAINAIQRDGRLPVTCSANCLQPDGQNDNDWDQGLLFLNPSQVWLQPPGYVTQMISRNYQPFVVKSEGPGGDLDVSVTKSEDGKTLVLQVVNTGEKALSLPLIITGFIPAKSTATVVTLEGPLTARNTADTPETIKPVTTEWEHGLEDGSTTYTFPAHSFTVIRL